jgi:hypothetical protein
LICFGQGLAHGVDAVRLIFFPGWIRLGKKNEKVVVDQNNTIDRALLMVFSSESFLVIWVNKTVFSKINLDVTNM